MKKLSIFALCALGFLCLSISTEVRAADSTSALTKPQVRGVVRRFLKGRSVCVEQLSADAEGNPRVKLLKVKRKCPTGYVAISSAGVDVTNIDQVTEIIFEATVNNPKFFEELNKNYSSNLELVDSVVQNILTKAGITFDGSQITFQITGLQGPAGPQGPRGFPGAQGPTGPAGADGVCPDSCSNDSSCHCNMQTQIVVVPGPPVIPGQVGTMVQGVCPPGTFYLSGFCDHPWPPGFAYLDKTQPVPLPGPAAGKACIFNFFAGPVLVQMPAAILHLHCGQLQ